MAMQMLVDPLRLREPIVALNGGVFVRPDFSVISESFLPADTGAKVIEAITGHGLDVWVYTDRDWLVRRTDAPYVAREQWTVKFAPKVVSDLNSHLGRVAKIVGVSDNYESVGACEFAVQRECGGQVSAARSQPYYLDVTHPDANKVDVVTTLSKLMSIPPVQIATIGDKPNDVLMFRNSGLSVSMGNSSTDVQRQAQLVTTSNEDEGFANAMEDLVLGGHRQIAGATL